jgi:hypothetical protein
VGGSHGRLSHTDKLTVNDISDFIFAVMDEINNNNNNNNNKRVAEDSEMQIMTAKKPEK